MEIYEILVDKIHKAILSDKDLSIFIKKNRKIFMNKILDLSIDINKLIDSVDNEANDNKTEFANSYNQLNMILLHCLQQLKKAKEDIENCARSFRAEDKINIPIKRIKSSNDHRAVQIDGIFLSDKEIEFEEICAKRFDEEKWLKSHKIKF